MEKQTARGLRLTCWWGLAMGALLALIAGNGTLAKSSIAVLAILGALGVILASWEHEWLRAPVPIGTPVRAGIAVIVILVFWGAVAVSIWPSSDTKEAATHPAAASEATIPAPLLPPSRKKLDSLMAAFKEPPDQGMRIDKKPMGFIKNGESIPIPVAAEIDNRTQTYSILLYIPSTPLTEEICLELADPKTKAYEYVRRFVKSWDSFMDDDTPLPENFMTIRDPKFSGTVIIYHEDKMTLAAKGKIDEQFRKHGMAVIFRGWDYVIVQNNARGY